MSEDENRMRILDKDSFNNILEKRKFVPPTVEEKWITIAKQKGIPCGPSSWVQHMIYLAVNRAAGARSGAEEGGGANSGCSSSRHAARLLALRRRMRGDVVLQAEGYEGWQAEELGIFERQFGVQVEGRPTYKKPGKKEFLFYNLQAGGWFDSELLWSGAGGYWWVGSDTSDAAGWWRVKSKAWVPGAITEPWEAWRVGTGTRGRRHATPSGWIKVPAAKIAKYTAEMKAAEAKALAAASVESEVYGDVILQAEGYEGKSASYLGMFELQQEMVEGRPTYKKPGKEEYLFYSTLHYWIVGSDTSYRWGWWVVKSTARTPSAITETWTVDGGASRVARKPRIEVPAANIVQCAAAINAAVEFQAEGYTGKMVFGLGIFKLQQEIVKGRPTYKKPGREEYLSYRSRGWLVGPDTSKSNGWWQVVSTAMTPCAITEPWMTNDGSTWVEEPAVKIVTQPELEVVACVEAEVYGDVVLQAESYEEQGAEFLGMFERQHKMVEGRPTYKKPGKEEYLFYIATGSWLVGPDTSKSNGWWEVLSAARTPGAITEPWTVCPGAGTWVEVPAAKITTPAALEAERDTAADD